MENEEVFQADAEITGLQHIHSRSLHRSGNQGHDTGKVASGTYIHDEESPLLSSSRENEGEEASEHGAGETRGPPKWDGEADFEGRPWWNKPSVRIPDSNTNRQRLTFSVVLAPASVLLHNSGIRWHHRPKSQPNHLPRMPRILLRDVTP